MQPIVFAGTLTLLLLLPGPRGHAQGTSSQPNLLPGARIRVTASAPSRRVTGTLISVEGDSLRLAVGTRDTVGVPVSAVTRLEESRGRRANYTKGALIGGGVGLAVGIGVGLLVDYGRSLGCESISCNQASSLGGAMAIGGLAGAGVGAGVGALLAGAFPKERWQPVVRPGGSVGLGLRLRF